METVVLVLMVLVTLCAWLKLTFMKVWQMVAIAAVCALFVGLSWPYAIEQSRNKIAEWLQDQPLMLDVSVILTLEVLWQMAFCLLAGKLLYGDTVKRRTIWIYRVLRFFPGVLIFPVLFYALIQAIYAFPGADFSTVAWSMAVCIFLCLSLGALGFRKLVPEKDLRLEILFLLSALVMLLGIIATVNGTTSFSGSDPIEWNALAAFVVLFLLCGLAGYTLYRRKRLHIINTTYGTNF